MNRKGFLTPELENWLIQNYRNKSDKELAEEATKMIESNIVARKERIESVLPMVTHAATRSALKRELEKYENFKGISVFRIRGWAKKLNCNGKSIAHVASMNRAKAKASNIKLWQSKAQKVDQFKTFLESMVAKEVRFVYVANQKQESSYRNTIIVYNREIGKVKGLFMSCTYKKDINVMRIEAKIDYSNDN